MHIFTPPDTSQHGTSSLLSSPARPLFCSQGEDKGQCLSYSTRQSPGGVAIPFLQTEFLWLVVGAGAWDRPILVWPWSPLYSSDVTYCIISQCKVLLGFDAMTRNGISTAQFQSLRVDLFLISFFITATSVLVLNKFLFVLSGPSLAMSYPYTSCHAPGTVIELESLYYIYWPLINLHYNLLYLYTFFIVRMIKK